MTRRGPGVLAAIIAASLTVACGSPAHTATDAAGAKSASGGSLTLYTCTSAPIEQAVVKAFQAAHHGVKVSVFRAPTGQLNARVAADLRAGGLKADVIWACDPLTMHGFDSQGLLRDWSPPNAADIPAAYRTSRFAGIDLLYMVVAVRKGTHAVSSWADLTSPALRGRVAVPSPTFAASALGLLGYFSAAPGYGIGFYQRLKQNGAVQVSSPTDTLTGVERGSYLAGITLANAAYADQRKGSPIQVVWPQPGGVAIYAPIGVTTKANTTLASSFAAFAASRAGQALIASQDTYPTLSGLGGPPLPPEATSVAPNWPSLFTNYRETLAAYARIYP